MRTYLKNLIEEKGVELNDTITKLEDKGHFGVTYKMLVDFIVKKLPKNLKNEIRDKLTYIDFKNGDVFHYLDFLAIGMVTVAVENF